MPHRRLVQIGKPAKPPLPPKDIPTISEYFRNLATKQGEDIRMLKERMTAESEAQSPRKRSDKKVREESWRLHPVVAKKSKARKRTPKKKSRRNG